VCDITDSETRLFLRRYTVSTLAGTLRLYVFTDHSMLLPPSSFEVTNECRYTFAPSLYLHDVVKDLFDLRVMK